MRRLRCPLEEIIVTGKRTIWETRRFGGGIPLRAMHPSEKMKSRDMAQ